MSRRRFKSVTAFILSLALIFTMATGTVFAADDDVTVKLIIKNDTFTKPLKNIYDLNSIVIPPWTGTLINGLNVTVEKNERVGDAIVEKLGDHNIEMANEYTSSGYITSVFNLGTSPIANGWAGWMYSYNGGKVYLPNMWEAGINNLINNPDTADEYAIKNGDVITLGYTVDFETIDQPYISVPKNVSIKSNSYNSNIIKWQGYGPTLYNDTDYDIYRSEKKSNGYRKIATVTSKNKNLSYTDSKLKTGTKYYYKVEMVKGVDKSGLSEAVSAKPQLSKPSVKITKKNKKSLKISWKKVDGAKKYQIYRATKKNGKYKKIKTVTSGKLSFTNKKLKNGKKYYYKVRAVTKVDGKTIYSSFSAKKYKKAG